MGLFYAFTDPENPTLPISLLVLAGVVLLVVSVLGPVGFFAGVLVQHAIIVVVAGRAHRGLRATVRASCYATGATLLLGWIPLVGFAAALYGACVYAVGLRRLHGLPPLRAGAALLISAVPSLALAVVIAVFAYNGAQTLARGPNSYYFPPPEAQKDLPPDAVEAAALMDGNEDQERIRKLREDSYSDRSPLGAYHTEISIVTADPEGGQRGVRGSAREAGGGTVRIDPGDPTQGTRDTDDILYYTKEAEASSPPDYYEDPVVQPTLYQNFMVRGGGRYTVELEQVGEEPRVVAVNLYSDPEHKVGATYFYLPYRVTEPGARIKIEISSGIRLDVLRLKVDRDANGTYEGSWMPEASVLGEGWSSDGTAPTTRATLNGSEGDGQHLVLDAEDRGSPDGETPASGVGITYYWIDGSGPRIYMSPIPVEAGDEITYWSIDRAANIEWRRTVDVGRR